MKYAKAAVVLASLVLAASAMSQTQKSFTGSHPSSRIGACDSAKKMAELLGYKRTGQCDCEKGAAGIWNCQVDASK